MSDPCDMPREQAGDVVVLLRFAGVMHQKLYENRHKNHWSTVSAKWLLNRARQELRELARALEAGDAREIAREAADVANFCMMIADNAAKRSKEAAE
jgi:NTP pyrophosphatase (non-canonical NTP hydrolase)